MATTSAGIGDSQVKPSCEFRLAGASVMPGTTWQGMWNGEEKEVAGGSRRPAVACLEGFRKF